MSAVFFSYNLNLNNYSINSNVKDFCHIGHFFDIRVNCARSKAKPLLTVCVIERQRKNARKSPSSADTAKANQRMQKGLQPSWAAGLIYFTLKL